jgi:hypothetical protein
MVKTPPTGLNGIRLFYEYAISYEGMHHACPPLEGAGGGFLFTCGWCFHRPQTSQLILGLSGTTGLNLI